MNITPGYDFTVNEVPTRGKLYQMVAGMSLTGIDLSQIDTNLVGIKLGDTATSLPEVGWMQVDGINCLWVKTEANITSSPGGEVDYGRVKIFRGNWGGWETNRLKTENERDTFTYSAIDIGRHRGIIQVVPNNDTNPSNMFLRGKTGGSTDTHSVKNLETGLTGLHTRTLMRGGHVAITRWALRTGYPDYVGIFHSVGVTDYNTQAFPSINATLGSKNRGMATRQTGPAFLFWAHGATLVTQ